MITPTAPSRKPSQPAREVIQKYLFFATARNASENLNWVTWLSATIILSLVPAYAI